MQLKDLGMVAKSPQGIGSPLAMNPALEVSPFDARTPGLVSCTLHSEAGTHRYVFPQDVVEFLKEFDGHRGLEEVIGSYAAKGFKRERPRLRALVQQELLPRRLLLASGAPDSTPPAKTPSRAAYVTWRRQLLAGPRVARLVEHLTWLFHPTIAALVLSAAIAIHVGFYASAQVAQEDILRVGGSGFAGLVLLSILSALWHELGHACALVRYGGKHPSIGIGVYLVYPVFYTDVSECWTLKRRERAVVDIAGIYFQAIFLIGLSLAGRLVDIPGHYAAFLWIDMLMLRSLNPLFRMDGFWMLTDFVGSTDLRRESLSAFRALARRLRAGTAAAPWTSEQTLLISYGLACVVALGYLYSMVGILIATIWIPSALGDMVTLFRHLVSGQFLDAIAITLGLAWKVLLATMFVHTLIRILMNAVQLLATVRSDIAAHNSSGDITRRSSERPAGTD